MIGAIAGDMIGSVYEFDNLPSKDFPLFRGDSFFTDDSILTLAVAKAILEGGDYGEEIWAFGNAYPDASYGSRFSEWLGTSNPGPYESWGNGAAMRVSPVGFAFDTVADVLIEAEKTAEVSHDHPEGVKGAQATALAVFLARTGSGKANICEEITRRFRYDLDRTVDEIRPNYHFDESCQGTVPEAVICFLESKSYEDAIRNAISLGGDSDTLACITGGIAEAYYGDVPAEISEEAKFRLTPDLLEIAEKFCSKYVRKK